MLSAPSPRAIRVNYATADGTATAGVDYTATSGTLTFSPGQTIRTLIVPIQDDKTPEEDETVAVTLSAPLNATIEGPNPIYLTIANQDKYARYLPIVWNGY